MVKFQKLLPLVALTFLSSVAIAFGWAEPIVRSQQLQTPTNAYTQKVTREVLASGSPTEVQGRVLELVKYTIPPNSKLPVHIHPGMQIERVESGTLTYTVVKGSAKITRSNGKEETLEAGKTTRLNVGDALVEIGGMVHYGENETDNPVVLLSASLFEEGKPKAILINP